MSQTNIGMGYWDLKFLGPIKFKMLQRCNKKMILCGQNKFELG
jgi:hypothetical protein